MADINLKTETPDTTLPTTGFLFGADSQAAASPSVYSTQTVATTLLGSTTLSGATITADAPVLNMSQTWNNGAVTFTGLKFNVASDTSAAASLLMDLQVGGTSRARLIKDGTLQLGGATSELNCLGVVLNNGTIGNTTWGVYLAGNSGDMTMRNTGSLAWTSGLATVTKDLFLTRRGAANLRFGATDAAAPVAQTLSVQSGTAGASATTVSISGTALTIAGTITGTIAIGHAVTGTGVSAGTLITAGSGTSWTVNNSQTVGPITAYFNSVGQNLTITGSQGSGPSAGGSIIFQVAPAGSAATTAQNALATALTIDSTRKATFAAGADFAAAVQGATNIGATNNLFAGGTFDTASVLIGGAYGGVAFRSNTGIGWTSSATDPSGTRDTILVRDTSNTLALRNGTNAQTFNIYNTFTSSTNFERFRIFAQSAAAVLIGTEKGSAGGTARALELQTDATSRLALDTVGSAQIVTALTVATLPGTPLAGMIARVTDATLPVIGATVAGGGAAYALVNYNGANWTVIGV